MCERNHYNKFLNCCCTEAGLHKSGKTTFACFPSAVQ